jgi:hypothetical protein
MRPVITIPISVLGLDILPFLILRSSACAVAITCTLVLTLYRMFL